MGAAITQDGGNLTILNNRFFSFWIIARIQKLLQSQKCTK